MKRSAAIGLTLLGAAGAIALYDITREPKDIGRYSLAFYASIPEHIRSIPAPEYCAAPRYTFEEDMLRGQVIFSTVLSEEEAQSRVTRYFEQDDCVVKETGQLACEDGRLVEITAGAAGDCVETEVVVTGQATP